MPKVLSKVVKQISISIELLLHRFPDVVNAETIRNELNQAAVLASGQNLIRSQLYFEFGLAAKDLVHLAYQLHRELLEPQIVA